MTAREIAGKAAGFAAVSPAALKLVGLLDQSDVANEEVVEVLKHDTVLTAKLLRACNAPSLAMAEPVASLDQAVFILGYTQVVQAALALAFGDALAVPMPAYAVEANEMWRHSIIVAIAGEMLAKEAGAGAEPAVAFTAGLLHDIGKVALAQVLTPEHQAAVRYQISEHAKSRVEAERALLGTDHAEVGACLLELWRFPEELVQAVGYHHSLAAEPPCRLAALILVANCLAHLAGSAPGWEAYALKTNGPVIAALGLTTETSEEMVLRLRESWERAEAFLANA